MEVDYSRCSQLDWAMLQVETRSTLQVSHRSWNKILPRRFYFYGDGIIEIRLSRNMQWLLKTIECWKLAYISYSKSHDQGHCVWNKDILFGGRMRGYIIIWQRSWFEEVKDWELWCCVIAIESMEAIKLLKFFTKLLFHAGQACYYCLSVLKREKYFNNFYVRTTHSTRFPYFFVISTILIYLS